MAEAAELDRALEQNEALRRENKILREELEILRKGLFGWKSERLQPGQPTFGDPEDRPVELEAPARQERPERNKPAKKGHGRSPFAANLLRDTQVLDVDEADCVCPT